MFNTASKRAAAPAAKAIATVMGLALLAGCATINTDDDTGTGKDNPAGGIGDQ